MNHSLFSLLIGLICIVCAGLIYAAVATGPRSWRSFLLLSPALGWLAVAFLMLFYPDLQALIGTAVYLLITYLAIEVMKQIDSFREARAKVPPQTADWLRHRKPVTWTAIVLLGLYLLIHLLRGPHPLAVSAAQELTASDTVSLPAPTAQDVHDEQTLDSLKANRP